jgi:surface carbohydrate biosynthesis protein
MSSPKASIIVPVENLVRELDSKLLFACVAAERGFLCIIGSRTEVDFHIARFSRGIYFSKSMTPKSTLMFHILRLLGHEIAVGDEESLVVFSPEHYFARRMSRHVLKHVSTLFAWGNANVELLRRYPWYSGTSIHPVGNPRIDLLRPELREFFEEDVSRIREKFGKFVMINTNFAMVNGFFDSFNVFRSPARPGATPKLGAAGVRTTREFATGFASHKGALFEAFKGFLAPLGEAFPEHTFILRPHPGENRDPWIDATRSLPNVQMVHEGNVVPWLLAADALIHNGCTTAVEAAAAGTPAITFRPVKADPYDLDLPNGLSHEATNVEELCGTVRRVLRGEIGCAPTTGVPYSLAEHLAALDGPLASDRIVDVFEKSEAVRHGLPRPPIGRYLCGRIGATQRRFIKRSILARMPEHRSNPAFQDHRFQGVSIEEIRARIGRFGRVLDRFEHVKAEPVAERIFRIST